MLDKMKNLSYMLKVSKRNKAPRPLRYKAEVHDGGIDIQAYWRGKTMSKIVTWEQIDQWRTPMWPSIFRGLMVEHYARENP